MHDLPHGWSYLAALAHARYAHREEAGDQAGRFRRQPWVCHGQDSSGVQRPRHGAPCPVDEVDLVAEVAERAVPRDELQQHQPVAVHVALLVHPQRVRVLAFVSPNKKKKKYTVIK